MTERLAPLASSAAAPFWEASRHRRLLVQWCPRCDRCIWYPREYCPRCLSPDVEWRETAGKGSVYACSTMPKAAYPGMAGMAPYAVALVDLEEGARLMSNVIGCAPNDVRVGMAVRVVWEELPDGRHLPLFEPVESAAPREG